MFGTSLTSIPYNVPGMDVMSVVPALSSCDASKLLFLLFSLLLLLLDPPNKFLKNSINSSPALRSSIKLDEVLVLVVVVVVRCRPCKADDNDDDNDDLDGNPHAA